MVKNVEIVYPAGVVTPMKKTAYLYRLYEKLRLEHNKYGKDFREGKITKQEWNDYLAGFNIKHNLIVDDILKARKEFKEDESWKIDLKNAFNL